MPKRWKVVKTVFCQVEGKERQNAQEDGDVEVFVVEEREESDEREEREIARL